MTDGGLGLFIIELSSIPLPSIRPSSHEIIIKPFCMFSLPLGVSDVISPPKSHQTCISKNAT